MRPTLNASQAVLAFEARGAPKRRSHHLHLLSFDLLMPASLYSLVSGRDSFTLLQLQLQLPRPATGGWAWRRAGLTHRLVCFKWEQTGMGKLGDSNRLLGSKLNHSRSFKACNEATKSETCLQSDANGRRKFVVAAKLRHSIDNLRLQ